MENKERVEAVSKLLNKLVRVTFEREAELSEYRRVLLEDSKEQKSIKEEISEVLELKDRLKDNCQAEIDNYGFVRIYEVVSKDENSTTLKKVFENKPVTNFDLIPYGFIMGRKLSKTAKNEVLSRMV